MAEKEVMLIDVNALRKDISETVLFSGRSGQVSAELRGASKVINRIEAAPTIDPESLRPQWISVKDRLPEQCGIGCLLCATNCYGQQRVFEGFTGYMEGGKFQWHTNLKDVDLDVWNITHWMPLPEPPKED